MEPLEIQVSLRKSLATQMPLKDLFTQCVILLCPHILLMSLHSKYIDKEVTVKMNLLIINGFIRVVVRYDEAGHKKALRIIDAPYC